MAPVLQTERLLLRPFAEDDAPALLAMDRDPEVMRYIGPYALPDENSYRERIRDYFQPYYARSPHFGFWAAEEKSTGLFIGWFHLRPAIDYRFAAEAGFGPGEFDVGYRLMQSAWGKGYATEITRALVDRGLALSEVKAIVACVLVENQASIRVLEKAGLRRMSEFLLPGFEIRAAKYALERSSWMDRRGSR
jgi:[ribosomal protein S5]-alanine N-acetyltransferase